MPLIDRNNIFQLWFIILLIPSQYLITFFFNSSPSQKASNFQEVKHVFSTINNYFGLEYWKNLCSEIYQKIVDFNKNVLSFDPSKTENKPKTEVPVIPDNESANNKISHYFATSPVPRSPRPAHVKYKIGQVFRHRYHGYRGVIIGWDPETYAPDFWIREMYPESRRDLIKLPSYNVLVDYRDKDKAFQMYVNEINIELLSGVQIVNNEVVNYFESFDGTAYIPRPKLKKLYPHD